MSTQIDPPTFDDFSFQYHLPQIYRTVLKDFRRAIHSYLFFHLFSLSLICGELLIFLPFVARSAMVALGLGTLFLTGFSYFVLYIYYQTRKPERFLYLKEMFLQSCRKHLPASPGEVQHHLSIAAALSKLASYLEGFEKNVYQTSAFYSVLLKKISSFFYWKDVFKFKKLLLAAAVEEHLKQIRTTPTDLEVHASLAATYVAESKIYHSAICRAKDPAQMNEQFRNAARLAIEEFQILSHYAPSDPWVHEQLAQGYKELNMPKEELREVEILHALCPQDKETLFRLGQLYFYQGMNAKGLQIYENLKQSHFKRAEELIASYGLIWYNVSRS